MSGLHQRRAEQKKRDQSALVATLVISLITHLAAIPPIAVYLAYQTITSKKPTGVKVVRVSRSTWQKNRSLKVPKEQKSSPKQEKLREKQEKEKEEEDRAPGQVVALPPPSKIETPESADYASEYDRRVEQETKSRHQTPHFRNPTNRPQVGQQKKMDKPSSSETVKNPVVIRAEPGGGPRGDGRETTGQGQQLRGNGGGPQAMDFALPKIQQRDRLALKTDAEKGATRNRTFSDRIDGTGDRMALRLGADSQNQQRSINPGPQGRAGGSGAKTPRVGALTPDYRTLERLSGAPANDYLADVEEDEATFLNTWRWKHAPFFNRVADSIRRQWNPGPAIARRDPSGNIYGFQDRYTLLRVTIDKAGSIQQINVSESCGVDFLDREAVLAFKRAEPFANPPRRLFSKEDNYTFYFGFNVDFQTSPLIQFNWRASP